MTFAGNTIIAGDIHGCWETLNVLISDVKPELIICCGDFGYYPNFVGQVHIDYMGRKQKIVSIEDGVKNGKTKILFCDGNHEDHWSLQALKDTEVAPNVFYMPRGSTYTLPDGRKILFMGGAFSIDKPNRQLGVDWFPEETISHGDIMRCPGEPIDIVVSHTCPASLRPKIIKKHPYGFSIPDCSEDALEHILQSYRPRFWYFGHWHMSMSGHIIHTNTKWYMLSMAGGSHMWWMFLH